jgi:hypothetical protein
LRPAMSRKGDGGEEGGRGLISWESYREGGAGRQLAGRGAENFARRGEGGLSFLVRLGRVARKPKGR